MILTGVHPSAQLGEARFIQIRDLDPIKRALAPGPPPTANRASPIALGDVLYPARGDRPVAILPDAGLIGAFATLDLYLLRPHAELLDGSFLAAFLNRPETRQALRAGTAGANLPRIRKESLAELDVPLPPLDVQRAIGCYAAAVVRQGELLRKLAAARAREADGRLTIAFARL